MSVHIEIYLREQNEHRPKLTYEIVDNDQDVLITPLLLQDCLKDYYLKDEEIVRHISADELEKRLKSAQKQVKLPRHITNKAHGIIEYIKKNKEDYYGIKIVGSDYGST